MALGNSDLSLGKIHIATGVNVKEAWAEIFLLEDLSLQKCSHK